MNGVIIFVLSALQITLLDLVLSGDNVGVIALAIRNLPVKEAKSASVVGVSAAICLRIFFACIVTAIMTIQWLPIKLIGGLLLLKITWDLVNSKEEDEISQVKTSSNFWKAVLSIIIADASMSLDNVLAIGGAANGHIELIIFGLLLNIPIIFFGSQFVANLMKKYMLTIFIGAAILVHTAITMIFSDRIIAPHIGYLFSEVFPWIVASSVIMYGFYILKKRKPTIQQS